MKITLSTGGGLSDFIEDLSDLMADLADLGDEALEAMDDNEDEKQKDVLRAAILKIDEALLTLAEAADILEAEE